MKKVSIITPWYNGISFVDRYMEMILSQTHPYLELIFVDDGSTDGVVERIRTYEPELKKRGIVFIYLFQDHAGQAEALNKGLKIFSGDYLVSIDSDDIFVPENIEKRVNFLENHADYAMVTSKGWEADEHDLENPRDVYWMQEKEEENLFGKIVDRKISTFLLPYMFRREAFLAVFPERSIYVNDKTTIQDVQIILPMTYRYSCGFIDEYLFTYVIWQTSGCHVFISYPHKLYYYDGFEEIWLHTYRNMEMKEEDRDYCIDKTKWIFTQYRMTTIGSYLLEKSNIALIESCILKNRQLIIFGAGEFGKILYDILREKGIETAFFLDNSTKKHTQKFCGLEVKNPEVLIGTKEKFVVLIAASFHNLAIKKQMESMAFIEGEDFFVYPSKMFFEAIEFFNFE